MNKEYASSDTAFDDPLCVDFYYTVRQAGNIVTSSLGSHGKGDYWRRRARKEMIPSELSVPET
jgi:hypothetical protein